MTLFFDMPYYGVIKINCENKYNFSFVLNIKAISQCIQKYTMEL